MQIAGFYSTSGGYGIGFVRNAKGKIRSFGPPGATETDAYSINDNGVVTGYFADRNGYHGFMRTP